MMVNSLKSADLGELAFRIVDTLDVASWLAIVVNETDLVQSGKNLHAELAELGESGVLHLSCTTADELESLLRAHEHQILIVSMAGGFSSHDWHKVDLARSRLERAAATILILTSGSLGLFESAAPNLASFLGGHVFHLVRTQEMGPADIAGRIATLQAWSGKTSEEVLAMAKTGTMPSDPQYTEWLTLLALEGRHA